MYDALVSADIVSDEPDRTAARLQVVLDLPVPRRDAFQEPPGHGFRAAWLRVRPSLREAPTRIEVIGVRPRTGPHDYVAERIAAQSGRPVRTHATVLAGDVDAVVERLRGRGVRHRVSPQSPDLAFPRVWVGVTPEDPTGYRAETDAGMWTEVVPTAHAGIPTPPREPSSERPAGVVRLIARRFLVTDLAVAVQTLKDSLALIPRSVRRTGKEVVARYEFRNAYSAALELVQPLDPTTNLGEFLARWGPGPHAIVIGVGDLDAVRARLDERRIAATSLVRDTDGDRLLLPPDLSCGVPIELVQI